MEKNFSNCLSACFHWVLQGKENCKESDLILCEYMLYTKFSNLAFESCINKMLDENISFFEIQASKELIVDLLDKEGYVILHIDAQNLDYADVYSKTQGINYHYILILASSEDDYMIKDLYIPTRPSSVYEGWIQIRDIHKAGIVRISNIHLCKNQFTDKEYLIHSMCNFINQQKEVKRDIIKSFSELNGFVGLKNLEIQKKLYKAAVNTAVMGIQASRKLFLEQYLQIYYNDKFIEEYRKLDNLYYTYRLLLLKNSVYMQKNSSMVLKDIALKICQLEYEIITTQLELLL